MDKGAKPAIDAGGFASLVEMIGPELPEMVAEIIETYLEEADELLALMDSSVESGNMDEMLLPVHSMKSSSASLGALTLSSICAELEQFLRGFGPDLDVGEYAAQIHVEYERAKEELTIRMQDFSGS